MKIIGLYVFSLMSKMQLLGRFFNAMEDYKDHGLFQEGLSLNQNPPKWSTSTIFSTKDYRENINCFRIPSVINDGNKIIAFSEARIHSCDDCSISGIVSKTSYDGIHFSNLSWVVYPTNRIGNFVPIYDKKMNIILAQYAEGGNYKDNHWDCVPAKVNKQIISKNFGREWSELNNISDFKEYSGLLPGPGNAGIVVHNKNKSTFFFAGHHLTASRPNGGVVVYKSNNLGKNYKILKFFEKMDEPALAYHNNILVLNMRTKDGYRAVAISNNLGNNWSYNYLDPELIDPICEGGLASINKTLFFTNPTMKYSRSNLSLFYKSNLNYNWQSLQITDPTTFADYSVILPEFITFNNHHFLGIIWGSCKIPLSFRPWCFNNWEIKFSIIPINKIKLY